MINEDWYDWHTLLPADESAVRQMKEQQLHALEIASKKICIAKIDGKWLGILNRCPHAGTPLSMGTCNKRGIIVCPTHHYKFQLSNGLSADGNHYRLPTFPIKIEQGRILVGIRKA
jgi:nitrite reductase/ring-hydroxylating ferredoxin subunit